jgi:hypothetical protein
MVVVALGEPGTPVVCASPGTPEMTRRVAAENASGAVFMTGLLFQTLQPTTPSISQCIL